MLVTSATFDLDVFWPHLEREKTHVIHTKRKCFYQAMADLKESVEENNKVEEEQKKSKSPDSSSTKESKKDVAHKLRTVEQFITPKAPQIVKRGLSDLRAYLGKRLTIVVVD